MYVNQTSGYVGIGTTNPAVGLHINGSGGLRLNRDNPSYGSQIVFSESETPVWYIKEDYDGNDGDKLQFVNASGGHVLSLDQDGDIGIGTTTPTAKLDVRGNVIFRNDGGNTYLQIRAKNDSHSFLNFGDAEDNDVGRLDYDHDGDFLAIYTNGTEKMRILNSGNVGIGTTGPGEKLAVVGADSGTTLASSGVTINIGNTDATANNLAVLSFGPGGTGNAWSRLGVIYTNRTGSSEAQDMFFGTIGGGSFSEVMRLTSTNKVG